MKSNADDLDATGALKATWLLENHPVSQSLADVAAYERKIKRMERDGATKNELTMVWMEIVTKKTIFKQLSSILYDSIFEVKRIERDVVRRFFIDLDGFTWKNGQGWLGQSSTMTREGIGILESPVCLYHGLQVERKTAQDAAVTSVQLAGQGCSGQLPSQILFEHCRVMDLAQNSLTGPLSSMSSMKSLQTLNLSGNGLSGTLAVASLHLNHALTHLDLSFNDLSGPIPEMFQDMPRLRSLNLAGNSFDGPLPHSLCNLLELEELRLHNNLLSGALLPDFAQLHSLRHINISQNMFSGTVNVLFESSTQLEVVQANNNQFSGRIHGPTLARAGSQLTVLQLQHNSLSGQFPEEFCLLKRLKILNLSHNQMRGLLPDAIGTMSSLEVLLLDGNHFRGPVPLSLAQLESKLRDFTLFKDFPAEWSQPPRAFHKQSFNRIYSVGPSFGVDSVHWNFKRVYGRERSIADDDTVTLFSGTL